MSALTRNRQDYHVTNNTHSSHYEPVVVTATTIYRGAVVVRHKSGGNAGKARPLVTGDATVEILGFSMGPESVVGDGSARAQIITGVMKLYSTGLTAADEGKLIYGTTDQDFSLSSAGGANPEIGRLERFISSTVAFCWVGPEAVAAAKAMASAGASYTKSILFSVNDFREMTTGGDVGAIAANGGILASDTTPILRGDANTTQEISWAAGNTDTVGAQVTLPSDYDGAADATLDLFVSTDNAGGGGIDAATISVGTSWDGGAAITDTATDGTPAVTIHKITATIAAADQPDAPSVLTILLTPAAHANDPVQLVGMRLNYKPLY